MIIYFIAINIIAFVMYGNFVNWTSGTGEGVTARMVGGMASTIPS